MRPNSWFVITNPETNEHEILSIKTLETYGNGKRIVFDLTDKQKSIKNPKIELWTEEYLIEQATHNTAPLLPVQHIRPPKPNKKWSRRYK